MSILEIVLYSLLGTGFITWLVITLINYKKKKNGKGHQDDED